CREPRRHCRSRDGHPGGHEGQLVASRDVKEPSAEKGAEGTAETAARLDRPEDRAKLWPREDVGRNRRELRDAHAEAKPRRRIEEKERQIVRASRQGETANSDQGDNRAERKYPPAAHMIREPATEEVSRHHARGPKGEEPDNRGLREATIHPVSDLVSHHDLDSDHPDRRRR